MSNDLNLKVAFSGVDKLSGMLKGIGGGSKKAAASLAGAKKEVVRLSKAQKQLARFKGLQNSFTETNGQLKESKKQLAAVRKEIKATGGPTAHMKRELNAASKSVERLSLAERNQRKELGQLRSSLSQAGYSTGNLGKSQRRLTDDIGAANRQLDAQKDKLARIRDLRSRSEKLKSAGSSISGAGARMSIGVTAPVAFMAKQSSQVAMDAQEMESAFDVVFGNMAASTRQWAEATGNDMQRSTQEMMRGSMAFQELFGKALDPKKSVVMSKQFAVLTQDLASFKNLSNDVAQQKLFSGLAGEAEPLRSVGVFLSEAKVQAAALKLGLKKVGGKLTEEQKIVARSKVISDELAKANGDVMRTSDSAANKLKALSGSAEELQVSVGTKLLTKLTPFIDKLNSLLDRFNALSPETQNFILIAIGLAAVLGPILLIIGTLVSGIGAVVAAFAGIGVLGSIFGVLGGGAMLLGKAVLFLGRAMLMTPIGLWVTGIAVAAYLIYTHWDWIKATFFAAVAWLGQAWAAITIKFNEGVDYIKALPAKMLTYGKAIVSGLVNGILAAPGKVWTALKSVVMGGIDGIKNLLGIKSPSRLFMALGGHITDGMALGLDKGAKRPLESLKRMGKQLVVAGSAVALTTTPASGRPPFPPGGGPGGSGGGPRGADQYHFHITQLPGEDADALADRIMEKIKQKNGIGGRSNYEDDF